MGYTAWRRRSSCATCVEASGNKALLGLSNAHKEYQTEIMSSCSAAISYQHINSAAFEGNDFEMRGNLKMENIKYQNQENIDGNFPVTCMAEAFALRALLAYEESSIVERIPEGILNIS